MTPHMPPNGPGRPPGDDGNAPGDIRTPNPQNATQTPTRRYDPTREIARWIGPDGQTTVLHARDVDDLHGEIRITTDSLHELMRLAGYIRTDNLDPRDAAT